MKANRARPDAPSAAELAAYLDGELPCDDSLRVELWLANNPDLANELESHADVTRRFQSDALPEPTPDQWDATLARIESGLATKVSDRIWGQELAGTGRRRHWLGWTAVAAAVMLFAFINMQPPTPRLVLAAEPFPVAEADDIEILSVHGRDVSLLVVGAIPLQEPLALVTTRDITVDNMQPDTDGMVPDMGSSPADSTSPMIVAPINGEFLPAKTP